MKESSSVTYSRWVGCIYIFNLIVGTGALAMPKAFQEAGWLLSSIVLTALCFLSYITTTFVIESMSISNGLRKLTKLKYTLESNDFSQNDINNDALKTMHTIPPKETEILQRSYGTMQDELIGPSLENILPIEDESNSFFEITETFEMGEMAIKYFNKIGLVLFYLSMCIYLYGDLAVYGAAVPLTLRDIACTYQLESHKVGNGSMPIVYNRSLVDSDPCWPNHPVSRIDAYRIFLTAFVALLCPFVFFNLSKTKFLQMATLSMRWLAFGIMFVLMGLYLGKGNRYGQPPLGSWRMSPNLFGICIYAFMCHHSLPSLITPINKKRKMYLFLLLIFVLILAFYLCLSSLASFTFSSIESLITLNFEPLANDKQPPITTIAFFQYYLMLFPVFTLSTSFPIIGVTLRNNLKNLVTCGTGRSFKSRILDRLLYPLLAIIPPVIIVYSTDNVQLLVGFTGSYAGAMIQYLVPISLVICARRHLALFMSKMDDNTLANLGISEQQLQQLYRSPFKHIAWTILIVVWTLVSIVLVTVNHILAV